MVGILVVFFNDTKHIQRIASALSKQTIKDFRLYVLDNNPTLNHIPELKKVITDFVEIVPKENTGFAVGNNLLAGKAVADGCKYLWILNPDMEPEPEALESLVAFLEKNASHIIVGPLLLLGDSKSKPKIQLYGCEANYLNQKKKALFSGQYLHEVNLQKEMEVNLVNGGSFLIRTEFLRNNYLFEKQYFMYNDEMDLMRRVKEARGKISVISNAIVWHHHDWGKKNSTSYNAMYYYMMRNKMLYFFKFGNYFYAILEMFKSILLFPVIAAYCIRTNGAKLIYFYYLGVLHGLLKKKNRSSVSF